MKKLAVDLMLDSGAFSAWNQGTSIDIKDYIAFVKRNIDYLWSYVVLDVLPEGKESLRTDEANERGAELSYRNLQIMKDAGLRPIPVFHQGEQFKWLEQMLRDGETYIGISTRKDLWSKAPLQRAWLNQVFSIITDAKGAPLVKTHGFGVTSVKNLRQYPWWTVDSTTWSMSAGYGTVYVPVHHAGRFDYKGYPLLVTMSQRGRTKEASPKWRDSRRGNFLSHGPYVQGFVRKFIEEECGLTVEEVQEDSEARRRANLVYFNGVVKNVPISNYKGRRVKHRWTEETEPVKKWTHLRMMFATSVKNKSWGKLMNEVGTRNRLVSYYELIKGGDEVLREFVTNGVITTKEPKSGRKKNRATVKAATGSGRVSA